MSKYPGFLLVFLIIFTMSIHAQSNQSSLFDDGFFIEGSVLRCYVPGLLEDLVKPGFGFRGALGYEYSNFRFALESGYSSLSGNDSLVEKISFVPLVLKFGYIYPITEMFGIQADVNFGLVFSSISRYETTIDMLINNTANDNERALFSGARLYTAITPLNNSKNLKIYAGGGADMLFEGAGPIIIPLLELGISIKPGINLQRTSSGYEIRPERATGNIVFSSRSENIVVEETARGRIVRLLNAVYFEADSAVMIEDYRPILDEAGDRLRANPLLNITLRGYTAPFGTVEGRTEISAARARYCAEYLIRQYGIAESRITIEYYGAERMPAFRDASWESYRCVELIIE